jgi:transcriptional regulator with XRE-family HTH domain
VSILPMDIRKVIGQNTRRYRLALGLTQAKVSIEMGVDRAYISSIERGLQNMTAIRMLELARVLRTTPAMLVTPEGDAPTPSFQPD